MIAGPPLLVLVPTGLEADGLFPGARLEPGTPRPLRLPDGTDAVGALCGFGPIAAAALAAESFLRSGAKKALLLGVAGTYRAQDLSIGRLLVGTEVICADVGRGSGRERRSAEDLGFPQVPASGGLPVVGDRLLLVEPHPSPEFAVRGALLTVASASGTCAEAGERAARHPDAMAEDMEAFGVALAAHRAGARLSVVRAVSNEAGEPDRTRWRLEEALAALRSTLRRSPG